MSDPVDPIAGVVAFLKADSAVSARTSGRVFGGELPRDQDTSMPRTCIVVLPAGGPRALGTAYQEYGDSRMDVLCYGSTLHEAWLTFLEARAALKALQREVHASVLLHWARESAGGHTGLDPETQWPSAVGSFQVLAAEVAAT